MWRALALLTLTMLPLAAANAEAQEAAAVYIVSYIEVAPAASGQVAGLLQQFAAASRQDEGNVRFEALQRIARPHHFAILEVWKEQKAQEMHAASAHTREFRSRLRPLGAAPYDERPHTALASGATPPAGGAAAQAPIYAVTHVDFIPPKKDEGIAALKELAEPSRGDPGNLRFDVLQQTSRPNHLTVVEVWNGEAALDAHAVAAHTTHFRDKLLPMSGSLYDERLYRAF